MTKNVLERGDVMLDNELLYMVLSRLEGAELAYRVVVISSPYYHWKPGEFYRWSNACEEDLFVDNVELPANLGR